MSIGESNLGVASIIAPFGSSFEKRFLHALRVTHGITFADNAGSPPQASGNLLKAIETRTMISHGARDIVRVELLTAINLANNAAVNAGELIVRLSRVVNSAAKHIHLH